MKSIKLFIIGLILIILSSCTTVPKFTTPSSSVPITYPPPPEILRQDVIHAVAPGETFWRISKVYDVPIEDIMEANKLDREDMLTMGQRILIPHALPARSVVPLYPSDKWKYIIIHHSATDEGNALTFYNSHKQRGFIYGLGYHFVIDNGSDGKARGYIEISPRWIKQQDGAHCKAAGMNTRAIGVCLVGNFSEENISDQQLLALVHLVNILRRYYHIPFQNIIGHGQTSGANTECPGIKFPWKKFFSYLKEGTN